MKVKQQITQLLAVAVLVCASCSQMSAQIILNQNGEVMVIGSGEVTLARRNSPGDVQITTLDEDEHVEDVSQIDVIMGNGDDRTTISGHLYIRGGLDIATGAGADVILISKAVPSSLNLDESLDISMGTGDDKVNFQDSMVAVGEDIVAAMGDDENQFLLNLAWINRRIKVTGGNHEDNVQLGVDSSSTQGWIHVGQTIAIATYSGHDVVAIYGTSRCRRMYCDTGPRNDTVKIDGLTVTDDSIVSTGTGRDSVYVFDSQINQFELETGRGNDFVELSDLFVESLTNVDLGQQHDRLVLTGCVFEGPSLFLGGDGFDNAQQNNCDFDLGDHIEFEIENFDF
jgi:hypothetical protein